MTQVTCSLFRFTDMLIEIIIDARALFESIVAQFEPQVARSVWTRWVQYESQHGTLEASLRLEQRIKDVFPKCKQDFVLVKLSGLTHLLSCADSATKRFAERYTYNDIDGIASVDLGARFWLSAQDPPKVIPQKRGLVDDVRDEERVRDAETKRTKSRLSPDRMTKSTTHWPANRPTASVVPSTLKTFIAQLPTAADFSGVDV